MLDLNMMPTGNQSVRLKYDAYRESICVRLIYYRPTYSYSEYICVRIKYDAYRESIYVRLEYDAYRESICVRLKYDAYRESI